jgi:hypothetical protein
MDNFEYDDIYELESDIYSKDCMTPQRIQEHLYNVVYNRNWKEYLNSIEWDGLWLKHDTPEEKRIKQEALEEHRRQVELETHPFRQWF